jgi:hypothetical protein
VIILLTQKLPSKETAVITHRFFIMKTGYGRLEIRPDTEQRRIPDEEILHKI